MGHPFFDAPTFPWHLSEAKALHEILSQVVYMPEKIDLLYVGTAAALPALTRPTSPSLQWREALNNLTFSQNLQQFCENVLKDSNIRTVHPSVLAVKNTKAPIERLIFSPDVLILDRQSLRGYLDRFNSDTDPTKVLLVRGTPKSGKSHSRYLFQCAADANNAASLYLCNSYVSTVDNVVDELFTALGTPDDVPKRDSTDEAWYQAVCRKLQAIALNKNQRLWIAVDDLGQDAEGAPLLDPEIRKFFEQFVLRLVSPSFSKWFRLMLIHYPDTNVPTRWHHDVWVEDHTSEIDIKQEHVAEIIREWAIAHRRTLLDEELEKFAASIVARAETTDALNTPRLKRLNSALLETFNALKVKVN